MLHTLARPPLPHPNSLVRATVRALREQRHGDLSCPTVFTTQGQRPAVPNCYPRYKVRASLKSFKRKNEKAGDKPPPDDPGNPSVDFHGEKRSNDTHESK